MKISKEKFEIAIAKACLRIDELSKISSVNKVSIAKIGKLNGNLRPATVGKLAKALGVDVTELLED